jgi:hypothetical protein
MSSSHALATHERVIFNEHLVEHEFCSTPYKRVSPPQEMSQAIAARLTQGHAFAALAKMKAG